jgi:hypothetical protein
MRYFDHCDDAEAYLQTLSASRNATLAVLQAAVVNSTVPGGANGINQTRMTPDARSIHGASYPNYDVFMRCRTATYQVSQWDHFHSCEGPNDDLLITYEIGSTPRLKFWPSINGTEYAPFWISASDLGDFADSIRLHRLDEHELLIRIRGQVITFTDRHGGYTIEAAESTYVGRGQYTDRQYQLLLKARAFSYRAISESASARGFFDDMGDAFSDAFDAVGGGLNSVW